MNKWQKLEGRVQAANDRLRVTGRTNVRRLENPTVIGFSTGVDRQPAIILFDAMGMLCSADAQFVLRHDRRRRFRLTSMQSDAAPARATA
jgi:hypothetical protein